MKKTKLVFWLLLFGLIGLLLFQNRAFYLSRHTIGIDLIIFKYQLEIPNAVLFLAFFFGGMLITYFFNLLERFKSGRTIKDLKASNAAQQKTIQDLERRLNGGPSGPDPQPDDKSGEAPSNGRSAADPQKAPATDS